MLITKALYFSWMDTQARYKKSVLGPLWLTLGNVIAILGLSLVWGRLLNQDMHLFVPSITIGMIVWQVISGSMSDGVATFYRQSAILRNINIPLSFFVFRVLFRQLINLFHNLIIILGVVWFYNLPLNWFNLTSLVGLSLLVINLYWIIFLLGMIGARFRDIEYLINAFLPILFFISPVIFRPNKLSPQLDIVWLNPISYFIEVIRSPFLGVIPPIQAYVTLVMFLLVGTSVTFLIYQKYSSRIVYWM